MTPSSSTPSAQSDNPVVAACQRVVRASWFQNFITGVIVFAAVLVGLETKPTSSSATSHERMAARPRARRTSCLRTMFVADTLSL